MGRKGMNMSLLSLSSNLAEKRKKAKRVAARKWHRIRVICVYFILFWEIKGVA